MVYKSGLAVALKVNGKVLREFKDQVYLPFNSEYSVLVKNLESRRVEFTVAIDGKDITDGLRKFVLDGNSEMEIERFLPGGNQSIGNKLKFIERTSAVENHRGIKIDDGLLRVEYAFERTYPQQYISPALYGSPISSSALPINQCYYSLASGSPGNIGSPGTSTLLSSLPVNASNNDAGLRSAFAQAAVQNDAGITVQGEVSTQFFRTASGFATEAERHAIIIHLLGQSQNTKVVKPVLVQTKNKCSTCGHLNKANAKFCSQCGTSLNIIK